MKKILSIDGGGIRGIIPALVLSEIEERTQKQIADCFDLIAGTSTGGILALGLSKNQGNGTPVYSASDLVKIYETRGKDIFPRSPWKGVTSIGGLVDEKYTHTGLEKVLDQYFGGQRMGDGCTKTLITCYDIQNREPLFLKSWKNGHKSVEMKYAARATSAAPTYFEPAFIPINGVKTALIDGGVFINSPTVSAYAEAKRLFRTDDLLVVSLGTGELTREISYSDAKDWGKLEWAIPLLSCIFDGVADASDYQMDKFLNNGSKKNYFRLQTTLDIGSDDLDDVKKGNIKNLKAKAEELIKQKNNELTEICNVIETTV